MSLKGGGDYSLWADMHQGDALSMRLNGGVKPSTILLTVEDGSYDLRDDCFTAPFPHPSCEFVYYLLSSCKLLLVFVPSCMMLMVLMMMILIHIMVQVL